jgi:hypothetical protein
MITAAIFRPDGATDSITLTPSGQGQYRGTYIVPNAPGYAEVRLSARGTDTNGSPFDREKTLLFQISPNTASLNTVYSDTPIARFPGSRLYQSLNVSVGVNATVNGTISLSADLVDGNGQMVAHSNVSQSVTVGANTLVLQFSGDDIYASQHNGPYTLTHLLLSDNRSASLVLAEADNVYVTASYQWRDFGPGENTPTPTPTFTPTKAVTALPTATYTITPKPTVTPTPTRTPAATRTPQPSRTAVATSTSRPTRTATFTPTPTPTKVIYPATIDGLRSLLEDLHQQGKVETPAYRALNVLLRAAERQLDRDRERIAIVILRAFIHLVQEQSGKGIDAKAARELVELAIRVVNSLR